jgi:hypothetical protein
VEYEPSKPGPELWPLSLPAIAVLGIAGIAFALLAEPLLEDDSNELLLSGILTLVAVNEVVLFRFMVMPPIAKQSETPARSIRELAAAAAIAIAVYGLALALMYSNPLAPIGFTAGALVAWQVFRSYVGGLPESQAEPPPRPHWGE